MCVCIKLFESKETKFCVVFDERLSFTQSLRVQMMRNKETYQLTTISPIVMNVVSG